jgi:anti-sigma B factor antagonist
MNNEIVPGFDDEKNDSIRMRLQKIQEVDKGLIIYATGYVDTYNAQFFQRSVERAIAAGFAKILFELSGVNYISSAGFAALVYFLRLVKPRNGDMVLQKVDPKVYEVAHLLGLAQFFTTTDNLDESIAYLANIGSSFPRVFACPVCTKKLRASKAGRFRCVECKTILVVDETTSVRLG